MVAGSPSLEVRRRESIFRESVAGSPWFGALSAHVGSGGLTTTTVSRYVATVVVHDSSWSREKTLLCDTGRQSCRQGVVQRTSGRGSERIQCELERATLFEQSYEKGGPACVLAGESL
jgi:hypothetical protein